MASASGPEEVAKRQQEYMKCATDRVVADTKEMAQMVSKSAMEMFDIAGKKISESLDRCTTKAKKATS